LVWIRNFRLEGAKKTRNEIVQELDAKKIGTETSLWWQSSASTRIY
jgi:hypothetical protein